MRPDLPMIGDRLCLVLRPFRLVSTRGAAKSQDLHARSHGWPDAKGEQDRAQAKRAAQRPADCHHRQFKAGAHECDGLSCQGLKASHEAIPGSRSQVRDQIYRAAESGYQYPQQREGGVRDKCLERWQEGQHMFQHRRDDDRVEDCADPRCLPERDPQEQDGHADDEGREPQAPPCNIGQAFREYCPGTHADTSGDQQCFSQAKQHQANDEKRNRHQRWPESESPRRTPSEFRDRLDRKKTQDQTCARATRERVRVRLTGLAEISSCSARMGTTTPCMESQYHDSGASAHMVEKRQGRPSRIPQHQQVPARTEPP